MADRDVLINENTMIAIANAIRNKSDSQTAYTPAQMPAAINQISGGSGGGSAITVTDTVDSHGGIIKTINAVDISDTTATAGDVASGKVFYTADGTQTTGTATIGGISIDDIGANLAPSGAITFNGTTLKLRAFTDKPITSIYAPNCTTIENAALQNTAITTIAPANFPQLEGIIFFNYMPALTSLKLDGAVRLDSGSNPIRENRELVTAEFPNAVDWKGTGNMSFRDCVKLQLVDLGGSSSIGSNCFYGDTTLRTMILRRTASVCTLPSWSSGVMGGIYNNPTESTIYVPQALISQYQQASNWSSAYAAGVTFAAIEGSQYELWQQ